MVSLLVEPDCMTLPLNGQLSVRLYRSNKPHCLETAMLQKGLILVNGGTELIEEGMGFGVPVVKYADKTLFSSRAQTKISQGYLEKYFLLDVISRKRFHKICVNDDLYELVHKLFEKAYLGHNNLQPVNNKIMELREILKIKTEFEKIAPRGVVKVKYACKPKAFEVSVDFSGLNLDGCREILVLNEQGACFGHYSDSDGLQLTGGRIGAWGMVEAEQATLNNASCQVGFSLERKPSARLVRGWEQTKNRFSWAGLSYSLPPSRSSFNYIIHLNY